MPAGKVVRELNMTTGKSHMMFWCPGCKLHHRWDSRWQWDQNPFEPTLTPSLITELGDGRICHLWMEKGKLKYLEDSWHELAGQTVEMRDMARPPDDKQVGKAADVAV